MQRTLQIYRKAIMPASPFVVGGSRTLKHQGGAGAECGGSGHVGLVPGVPGGPQQSAVRPLRQLCHPPFWQRWDETDEEGIIDQPFQMQSKASVAAFPKWIFLGDICSPAFIVQLPDHWVFPGLWTALSCCSLIGITSH